MRPRSFTEAAVRSQEAAHAAGAVCGRFGPGATRRAPAQIHRTFAIYLPDCITLLMVPCGLSNCSLRINTTMAAGRGLTV